MNWINNILRKRRTKRFIKYFIANISDSIIIEQWKHRTWGDAIYIDGQGFHGCISNLRSTGLLGVCDLRNGDVIVMDVSHYNNPATGGRKYELGLFTNVRVCDDPPDMFFASYLRLGFADDYDRKTIKRLALERIENL